MKPKQNYKPGPKDNFQTPPYAVDPLVPYLDMYRYRFWPESLEELTIWESASGEGLLACALRNASDRFHVIETDIAPNQNAFYLDFLNAEPQFDWHVMVTNPPFSLKYKWLERAFQYGKPLALLVPLETLGAASAQNVFRQEPHNFSFVFFNRRINYKTPYKGWDSSAQFPSVWILYKLSFDGIIFAEIENKPIPNHPCWR